MATRVLAISTCLILAIGIPIPAGAVMPPEEFVGTIAASNGDFTFDLDSMIETVCGTWAVDWTLEENRVFDPGQVRKAEFGIIATSLTTNMPFSASYTKLLSGAGSWSSDAATQIRLVASPTLPADTYRVELFGRFWEDSTTVTPTVDRTSDAVIEVHVDCITPPNIPCATQLAMFTRDVTAGFSTYSLLVDKMEAEGDVIYPAAPYRHAALTNTLAAWIAEFEEECPLDESQPLAKCVASPLDYGVVSMWCGKFCGWWGWHADYSVGISGHDESIPHYQSPVYAEVTCNGGGPSPGFGVACYGRLSCSAGPQTWLKTPFGHCFFIVQGAGPVMDSSWCTVEW